jgi:hypothetical protein
MDFTLIDIIHNKHPKKKIERDRNLFLAAAMLSITYRQFDFQIEPVAMAKCLQMTSILHSRKRSLLAHNKVHPESYTSAREEKGLVGMMQQQLDRQENKFTEL